ncbi:hypothetical protein [Solibacillus sp. FSL K6-1523]|uniref:hypothetical protein n=1 Tax=Solibacillus sp. FSL K6-1523 TaxID=2921471 RepID=UPI0030FBC342
MWKVIIAILVGLFSFSFTFTVLGHAMKIAILPLGLWLLYWLLGRRNSWEKYRKYAWLGFFANYLFFIFTVGGIFIHQAIYPKENIHTYISDLSEAKIIPTHPSAKGNIQFERDASQKLENFKEHHFFSDEWYREAYGGQDEVRIERFPYLVTDAHAKWGSGYTPLIYIEQDGKGVLITTGHNQIYFKSEQSIIGEVSANE